MMRSGDEFGEKDKEDDSRKADPVTIRKNETVRKLEYGQGGKERLSYGVSCQAAATMGTAKKKKWSSGKT